MSYIIDKVADIVFDSVIELGKEKLDDILEERKLKKIFRNSIRDYNELQKISGGNREEDCIIDRKEILALDKKMIMPNLTVEELETNLFDFFKKCIRTDNKEKAERIRKYICHNYKLGVAGLISISQVDEDVHRVVKTVRESEKRVLVKINTAQAKIVQEIKKLPAQQLIFIDELDDSKVYCYVSLQLTTDVEDDYLQELADNIFAEYNTFFDKQDFFCVSFNFLCPIKQYELRDYLGYLNEEFGGNDIGILSIMSHF